MSSSMLRSLLVLGPRVLLAASLLAGCGGFGFAGISAKHIDCRSREIVVTDLDRSGDTSWTASCRGKSYRCEGDAAGAVTCREKGAPPPASPAPPAPPAAPVETVAPAPAAQPPGCQYDTQCKGDRLCLDGKCVAPPAQGAATGDAGAEATPAP